MVLIAATPSQPALIAAAAGCVMSVMLGVILAHTGTLLGGPVDPPTHLAQKLTVLPHGHTHLQPRGTRGEGGAC
jgi:hypothetical protein